MYSVSQKYIEAVKAPSHIRKITGYIGSTPFDDENIVGGTLVIDNACSEGMDVKIGSVYVGQLQCIFTGIDLTGEWYGKTITLSEGLLVDEVEGEEEWEFVPLGTFDVVEANHFEDGVHVTAYDRMQRFEKTLPITQTLGSPYDLLMLCCSDCNVTLKQTQAEIEALPNGNKSFVLYGENDIETYRDLIFWVAQLMCCFATMTRDGKLDIRMYGRTTVDSIGITERWRGASFSDFTTKYTGVSVVQIDNETTVYKGLEVDDGLTYNLGPNPLLQNIALDEILENILTALSYIQYTPFSVDKAGNPALDLGDQVTFPGGLGRGSTGCIMSYDYTYHGAYTIQGFGSNPALANAKSKTDKELAGLMSRTNANQLQYYTYTNAKPFEIHDEYEEVISIRFGSTKQTLVTFQAEIALENEIEDQDVDSISNNIKYLLNNVEQEYKPVETWIEGKHLLHLLYLISIGDAALNTLKVRMNSLGGVTYVLRGNLNAVISGQGLVATDKWDGYIEAEQNIVYVDFGTTPETVDDFDEEAEVALADVIRIDIDESVDDVALDTTPKPMAVDGVVYINKKPIVLLTWGDVKDMEWSADGITDGEDTYSW